MIVSLILATVGRSDDVGRLIRSLVAQTDRHFELIVVDQNTDDRLLPFIEDGAKAGIELQHLRLDRPSLSGARNLGLAHATGEIVAFPDDDCWYEPEGVANVLSTFADDHSLDGVIGCWVEQAAAHATNPQTGMLSCEAWRRFRGGDASSISLFLKRDLLSSLGGFDENFGVGRWYGAAEETDFILRALSAGACLTRSPNVRVHHHFNPESAEDLLTACRSARKRARGTGGIYAKHQLDAWVVIRGLLAPIAVPLSRGKLRAAIKGAYVTLGRAEGLISWKFR
jgi:glycosyltransferase involved in cell wall biosynthesis